MGHVCSNDMGLLLERDPDTVRGPDVVLYLERRSYADLETKYPERLPALVVEVISPTDRAARMLRRVTQFLTKGVSMVWVLDPEGRDLTVYRPNATPVLVGAGEELTGYDVLPDFRCKVAEFFDVPGEPEPQG
jgi:Uma2 family endonuclease